MSRGPDRPPARTAGGHGASLTIEVDVAAAMGSDREEDREAVIEAAARIGLDDGEPARISPDKFGDDPPGGDLRI